MRLWSIACIAAAAAMAIAAQAQLTWPGPVGGSTSAEQPPPRLGTELQVDVLYDTEAPVPLPGASTPFFNAPPTEVAPVIDGKLDDQVWQGAPQVGKFVLRNGQDAQVQTKVWMIWDKDNIYLAFKCEEPQADLLKRGGNPKLPYDDAGFGGAFSDNNVYVVIEPNNSLGAKGEELLVLNADGKSWAGRSTKAGTLPSKAAWSPKWDARRAYGDGFWSAEMEIPFPEIGARPGSVWGMNFGRSRNIGDETESSWWLPAEGVAAAEAGPGIGAGYNSRNGWVMMGRSKLVLTGLQFPQPLWGNNSIELSVDSPGGNVWLTSGVTPQNAGSGETISTSLGASTTRSLPVKLNAEGLGRVGVSIKGPREWAQIPTWFMPWQVSMGVWVVQQIAGAKPVTLLNFSVPYKLPRLIELGRREQTTLGGQPFVQVPLTAIAEIEWLQTLKWTISVAPEGKPAQWHGRIDKLRLPVSTLNIDASAFNPGNYTFELVAMSGRSTIAKASTQFEVK